jgi:hypothetical protein
MASLLAITSAAFASQAPLLLSSFKSPLCYCKCEHETGKQCTKMCELPQYEKRWWAVSCHKKSPSVSVPGMPARNSNSRKTNRKEEARL